MATTPEDLWRAVDTRDMIQVDTDSGPVIGVLCPAMSRHKVGVHPESGEDIFRDPEVAVTDDMVQPGGGTSLFNQDRFLGSRKWHFFYVPRDTVVPPELNVSGPTYNVYFDANHYLIETRKPIPVSSYRGALDNFARAAFAKRYADARRFTGPGR
ncbi:hypothetical protein DXV76_07940 [Rhodobacteraceae bacterium CCMM004]|nr:hypothetical protein DXV76_07940 [Rhodobacteraceae bacterium CCMM004]